MIIAAECCSGSIHDFQILRQDFIMGNCLILDGIRELMRVFVIDAIDHGRLTEDIRFDLGSAKCGACICREERVTGSAGEDDDPLLLKVSHRTLSDIRFCHLTDIDCRHDTCYGSGLFKRIRDCKSIHKCGQHTHMVRCNTIHILARSASPEVSAADNYGYFDTDEQCLTKTPGVYVAGDCRSKFVRQLTTAAADGAVAALAACAGIK